MTFKERDDMLLAVIWISELNLLKTNDVWPFHVPINQSCYEDSTKILEGLCNGSIIEGEDC